MTQKELKKHGNIDFPMLISEEKLSDYESGSFIWHWHPEIEITYIKKGQIIYRVNNHTFHLKTGNILLCNSNVLHTGRMENNRDCEYISITLLPKLIYGTYESLLYKKYVEPIVCNMNLSAILFDASNQWYYSVFSTINTIIDLYNQKLPFYELELSIQLQSFWKIIAENYLRFSYDSMDTFNYERIRSIMTFIEKNHAEKISLNDISDFISLCNSECSRLFKRYMNVSLFKFLQEYRIEKSMDYLTDYEFTISQIAGKVGFSDSNYYSKIFKKLKGISPREYRKNISRNRGK
jgi:AraC-like DNA-binding protein/mannose-6-phosphate isomerase-like protein (cupin superfamily)